MNDDEFVRQFEARTFPFDQWRHRAHVKLAYIYYLQCGFDEAGRKLRDGIRAYNAANNIIDQPTSGYHETLTQFWLHVIQMTVQEYGPRPTADDFFEFHPQLSQKKIHRLFYSADLFMSAQAKREFVEPDLARLPRARHAPTA